jgi:hypothetical protein
MGLGAAATPVQTSGAGRCSSHSAANNLLQHDTACDGSVLQDLRTVNRLRMHARGAETYVRTPGIRKGLHRPKTMHAPTAALNASPRSFMLCSWPCTVRCFQSLFGLYTLKTGCQVLTAALLARCQLAQTIGW